MKLVDYINEHHNGNNAAFAKVYGCTRQHVGEMVERDTYYVYGGWLHIRRKQIKED